MPVTTNQPQQSYNYNPDQQHARFAPPTSANSQFAHPQQAPPPPPRWVQELIEASEAGENEFRKEVRKAIIEENHGAELVQIFTDLEARETDEEKKKDVGEMLADIKRWVADPSELEQGGRFLGLGRRRMGMGMGGYGSVMNNYYYGGYPGGYGGYPYSGYYPTTVVYDGFGYGGYPYGGFW